MTFCDPFQSTILRWIQPPKYDSISTTKFTDAGRFPLRNCLIATNSDLVRNTRSSETCTIREDSDCEIPFIDASFLLRHAKDMQQDLTETGTNNYLVLRKAATIWCLESTFPKANRQFVYSTLQSLPNDLVSRFFVPLQASWDSHITIPCQIQSSTLTPSVGQLLTLSATATTPPHTSCTCVIFITWRTGAYSQK